MTTKGEELLEAALAIERLSGTEAASRVIRAMGERCPHRDPGVGEQQQCDYCSYLMAISRRAQRDIKRRSNRMKNPKVISVDPRTLIPNVNNPNKMSDEDFRLLCASVAEHGMVQPVLVQKIQPLDSLSAYAIVDGHHRVKASIAADLKTILAVEWDGSDGMRRILALGMNNMRGDLDLAEVQKIITELHESGWQVPNLTLAGYAEKEISELLQLASEMQADADAVMENPIAPPQDEPRVPRPLVLELTFATAEELQRAKRALRRAAGKGHELGEGLLRLIGDKEE